MLPTEEYSTNPIIPFYPKTDSDTTISIRGGRISLFIKKLMYLH